MGHQPGKVMGSRWNWPQNESMCSVGARTRGSGLPKTVMF